MTRTSKETYLGDGLYASHDGFQYWLRAPRSDGDHRVALDVDSLRLFLRYVEATSHVTITVKKNSNPEEL